MVRTMEPGLWCIKYNPTSWDDFIGDNPAILELRSFAEARLIPNMIIYGPSGVGKSAAVNIYCHQVLGDDFSTNFKMLNIRELLTFPLTSAKRSLQEVAKTDPSLRSDLDEYMTLVYAEAKEELRLRGTRSNPSRAMLLQTAIKIYSSSYSLSEFPLKILVLEEAEAMTSAMQQALRRTMELYSDTTRFIFVTESLAGWSPAVVSRSLVLRFNSPPAEAIAGLLTQIAQNEGVKTDEFAIGTISRICDGNVRRAINLLQMASSGVEITTEDDVYAVSQTPLERYVHDIITLSFEGAFLRARNMMRELLATEGYDPHDVIRQMQLDILNRPLDQKYRNEILQRIAEIESRLIVSKNPHIQLTALITSIARMGEELTISE